MGIGISIQDQSVFSLSRVKQLHHDQNLTSFDCKTTMLASILTILLHLYFGSVSPQEMELRQLRCPMNSPNQNRLRKIPIKLQVSLCLIWKISISINLKFHTGSKRGKRSVFSSQPHKNGRKHFRCKKRRHDKL